MTDDHKASQGILTVTSSIGVCVFDNNEVVYVVIKKRP